jgi:hypothetical protein
LKKRGATGGGDITLDGILEYNLSGFAGKCDIHHTYIIPDL